TGAEAGTEADATAVLRERGRRGEQERRSGGNGLELGLHLHPPKGLHHERGQWACSASCACSTDTAMYTVERSENTSAWITQTNRPRPRNTTGQRSFTGSQYHSFGNRSLMIPNTRWSPNMLPVSRSVSAKGRAKNTD